MNIKSIVEEPLKEIWQEEIFHEFCQYPPMSVSSLPENAILFVGLNPSLSEKQKQILSANQCQQLVFYDTSIEKHSYFNKFKEIGNHLNCNWGHFDLLFLQETKQNKVADLLKSPIGQDFVERQLQVTRLIFDQLLKSVEPIIFVVNNSLSRDLLQNKFFQWFDYDLIWDDNLGTSRINQHPFFFTSMLTGQRALDKGSFERLIWHIKLVKEKQKLF